MICIITSNEIKLSLQEKKKKKVVNERTQKQLGETRIWLNAMLM